MRGALLTALLASFLPSGAPAQDLTQRPKPLWPTAWRNYHSRTYCYSIKFPISGAELDTTDQASVKVRITRARHPLTGADVPVSWVFLVTVTPNPAGVTPDHWLEPGSGTPDTSSGIAQIVEILWRRNLNIAGRTGIRKQVEGSGQRRNACFIAHKGYMYGVSYPVLDLDHQEVLKASLPTIEWWLDNFELDDPAACRIAVKGG
jgi:hypothetical protein